MNCRTARVGAAVAGGRNCCPVSKLWARLKEAVEKSRLRCPALKRFRSFSTSLKRWPDTFPAACWVPNWGGCGRPYWHSGGGGRRPWSYFFRIIIPYESSPESSQIWCDGWHLAAMSFALHSSLIRLARFIRGKVALAFPNLESQWSAMGRATQHFLAVSPDRKQM